MAPIKDADYEIPGFEYRSIYISTLSRSRDTANRLPVEAPLKETGLINEVPLKSGFDSKKKLPLWFWNITGRLQWVFNASRQAEGSRQTRVRAARFAEILCKDVADCLVVTHGFYMHTLLRELKKAGFRISRSRAAYRNGEYVVAER